MKPRNLIAKDMFTNGLYRAKIVESKKAYKRKSKHKELYDADTRHKSEHTDYSEKIANRRSDD